MSFDGVVPTCREWSMMAAEGSSKWPPRLPVSPGAPKTLDCIKGLRRALAAFQTGKPMSVQCVVDFARAAASYIGAAQGTPVIRDMCQPLYGCNADRGVLDLVIHQIAGNRRRILSGEKVELYAGREAETRQWAPAIVTDIVDGAERRKMRLRLKILDGPACGTRPMLEMSQGMGYMLSKAIGATVKLEKKRLALDRPKEFVMMSLLVALRPGRPLISLSEKGPVLCDPDDVILGVRSTASQKKSNAALALSRMDPCPFGRQNPCYNCEVGYDRCDRGCRPSSLIHPKNERVEFTIGGHRRA